MARIEALERKVAELSQTLAAMVLRKEEAAMDLFKVKMLAAEINAGNTDALTRHNQQQLEAQHHGKRA